MGINWLQEYIPGAVSSDNESILEEGISDFEKALALDPEREDAMAYLNLLLRERAERRDSEQDRHRDIAAADRWLQKSTDVRSEKFQAAFARTVTGSSREVADPDAILHQWAWIAVRPAPPPPPPSMANGRKVGGPVSAGVVSWEPKAAGSEQAPPPIRVQPAEQEQKLITKVNPEYPAVAAEAGVTGTVRFVVVIGKDGRTVRETPIRGHPLLVQAALEAVRQWVYRPTVINGKAVEVVSEVPVISSLALFAKMKGMRFFRLLACLTIAWACFADSPKTADASSIVVRGKLVQREGQTPGVETADHKLIVLEGDGSTEHVLHDKRLAGLDLEAAGHFTSADHFQVDPFHTHSIHVIKDGKRLTVTYWCDVCSIRQYEPGPCWCCQRETALELREPD